MNDYVGRIDEQGYKITRIDNEDLYGHGPKWNASIIDHNGKRLLSYRQYDPRLRIGEGNGMTICISELNKKNLPTGKYWPLDLHGIGQYQIFEDARLFHFQGDLWLSYTEVVFLDPSRSMKKVESIAQHACKLEGETFKCSNRITLDYGLNTERFGWEKNWCWFEWEGRLFMVYDPRFNTVLEVCPHSGTIKKEWKHEDLKWPYGHFRGGTPPVLHKGEFISFWHGSTDDPLLYRRYYIGAYTFEAKPPFRPLRVSKTPIIYGSSNEWYCGAGNKMCIFPMGKRRIANGWQIAAGINDSFCGVINVPDASLNLVDWGYHKDLDWKFYRMAPAQPYLTMSGFKNEYRITRTSGMTGNVAVLKTKDPFTILAMEESRNVTPLSRDEFLGELKGLERQLTEKHKYSYLGE